MDRSSYAESNGEAPNYLSVAAVLEFAYNCLVAFATGLYNFASNLLRAGIDLVCNIYSAVTTTITKIADVFNAFAEHIPDNHFISGSPVCRSVSAWNFPRSKVSPSCSSSSWSWPGPPSR